MQTAIDQFRTNINRVRNLGSIFEALDSQTTSVLDLSDILRAELVLAVRENLGNGERMCHNEGSNLGAP